MTETESELRRSIPFDHASFRWEGVEERDYKDYETDERARGMRFRGVKRFTLTTPKTAPTSFEQRYFEFEPGGFSALEKHEHVHSVIVVRGRGRALIGDDVFEVGPLDALYVGANVPHRWLCDGDEPFGFLCTVDGERDRPQPLDDAEWEALGANPKTAPYVY